MKILIIGNIGSGKTTLGEKIQELTGYKFVQIDVLRELYLNNSVSGEYLSQFKFLKSVERKENMIFEFTGIGCHKFAVKRALELTNDKKLIICCKTRQFGKIIKRVNKKTSNYANIFNSDINKHIYFIKKELKKDILNKFWKLTNSKFKEFYMDNFNDLDSTISILEKELTVNKNQNKSVKKKMDLDKWRDGINLCIDNVSQLVDDGKTLMGKESFGHACFLFLTAFEEMAVAYFIIDRFNSPAPEKIHKRGILNHFKKFALARFKTFMISGDFNSLNDFLKILRETVQNGSIKNYEYKLKNLEKKIQSGNNFWDFRNNCIYTSLNQRTFKFISPKYIDQKNTVNLYTSLVVLLIHLQIHRDIVFKYGLKYLKYTKDDIKVYESFRNLSELLRIIGEGNIDKLEEFLKPDRKLLQVIKDFKKDSGNILNIQKLNDFFQIILKDFAKKIIQMEKKEDTELTQFVLKRLKDYNPKFHDGYILALDICRKISENKFNIEDYPKLLKGIRENVRRLKFTKEVN